MLDVYELVDSGLIPLLRMGARSPAGSSKPVLAEGRLKMEMAYISRCACGCEAITFATVDRPEWAADTAKTIAKLIREGRSIERVALGNIRMSTCKRQADLLKAASI